MREEKSLSVVRNPPQPQIGEGPWWVVSNNKVVAVVYAFPNKVEVWHLVTSVDPDDGTVKTKGPPGGANPRPYGHWVELDEHDQEFIVAMKYGMKFYPIDAQGGEDPATYGTHHMGPVGALEPPPDPYTQNSGDEVQFLRHLMVWTDAGDVTTTKP